MNIFQVLFRSSTSITLASTSSELGKLLYGRSPMRRWIDSRIEQLDLGRIEELVRGILGKQGFSLIIIVIYKFVAIDMMLSQIHVSPYQMIAIGGFI